MIRKIKRHKLTPKQREDVYCKYNKHCAYCGCEIAFNKMEIDHLTPVYHFEIKSELQDKSPDDFDNLMPACRSCNRYKDTYNIETFREVISKIPFKLRRDHKTFSIGERFELIQVNEHPVEFYFEKCEKEKRLLYDRQRMVQNTN